MGIIDLMNKDGQLFSASNGMALLGNETCNFTKNCSILSYEKALTLATSGFTNHLHSNYK